MYSIQLLAADPDETTCWYESCRKMVLEKEVSHASSQYTLGPEQFASAKTGLGLVVVKADQQARLSLSRANEVVSR